VENETPSSSGEFSVSSIGFWDANAGKILATLIAAFAMAACAWAVQMDRQSVDIASTLKQIQRQLDDRDAKFRELDQIDRRLGLVEATRFTQQDARKMRDQCDALRLRVSALESKRSRR